MTPREHLKDVIIPGTQEWLLEKLQIIYPNIKIDSGVCFGGSYAVLPFILKRHKKPEMIIYFNDMLKTIYIEDADTLTAHIEKAKENRAAIVKELKREYHAASVIPHFKRPKLNESDLSSKHEMADTSLFQQRVDERLSSEDMFYLDIASFLDSIVVTQHFDSNVFEFLPNSNSLIQADSIDVTLPLILPEDIKKNGGLLQTRIFSGMFNIDNNKEGLNELDELCNAFAECIKNTQFQYPLAFVIHSSLHAFTLSFDYNLSEWLCLDLNDSPFQTYSLDEIGTEVTASCTLGLNELQEQENSSEKEEENKNSNTDLIANVNVNNHSMNYRGLSLGIYTLRNPELIKNSAVEKQHFEHFQVLMNAFEEHPVLKKLYTVTAEKASVSDYYGDSWLFLAIRNKEVAKVRQLIKAGANVNAICGKDKEAENHLFWAARTGNEEIFAMLLEAGAIPYTEVVFGAIKGNNLTIVKNLLDDYDFNHDATTIVWGIAYSFLSYAAFCGHTEILEELLKPSYHQELNPDYDAFQGAANLSSPLQAALEANSPACLRLLLMTGADPNQTNKDINEPLCEAISNKQFDCVELLLDYQDIEDISSGQSPIIAAIKQDDENILRLLLQRGALVNNGVLINNPLYCAIEEGNVKYVRILLEFGAKLSMGQANDDDAALNFAKNKNRDDIYDLLLSEKLKRIGENSMKQHETMQDRLYKG